MKNTCETCVLGDKNQKVCRLYGTPIEPSKDFCSKHSVDLQPCEICGRPMLGGKLAEKDDNGVWHWFCLHCNQLLGTCQSCNKFESCKFETDPNPLPKVVMKTVRQGNMVMQTQIKNEERIKALCPTCDCWNEEFGCLKELNEGCNKKSKFWN